ncbi:two-component system, OmpR family, sensor histidine kinase PhoQ [Ferrimonas sediminum]|uniref:histidine kinase n=1 Tax=Ferrimonas sediminum TaxID=718193 RepID=A0A1G9AKF1_9GAMM|nr:ATP-binding protein [Ferrimonas sediminum]SDK27758.1 two-component system, OmpR family, sensor histidine kinase PhoQ [Ferrimonas sediminum]
MKALFSKRPRLQRRLMMTSLAIIALASWALAEVINQQKVQDFYVDQTNDIIARLPMIAAELRLEGMLPQSINPIKDYQSIPHKSDYLLITCVNGLRDHYTSSEEARKRALQDTCNRVRKAEKTHTPPYLLTLADDRLYSIVRLPVSINQKSYDLLVLRDAERIQRQLAESTRKTYFRVGLFIPLSGLLLVGAGFWGLRPLRRLSQEVKGILKGDNEQLSSDYPVELTEVTQALNELIGQEKHQRQTYQHAMKDLAHSLKTRLAATNAIMEDRNLTERGRQQEILSQLGQMDQIIQYQLRRAVVGRQGLTREQAEILPTVEQLTSMLGKVYQEKQIQVELQIDRLARFPGNQDDLMEMLGNLLENAYRFAISTVRIRAWVGVEGGLCMAIEDDGPGIEPEMRQSVLERGVRADRRNPGQGIGLAVVHDIVLSYKGTMTIDESELRGAQIRLDFEPSR